MIVKISGSTAVLETTFSEWYIAGVSNGWTVTATDYLVHSGAPYARVNALGHFYDSIAEAADRGDAGARRLLARAMAETRSLLLMIVQEEPKHGSQLERTKFIRAWRTLNSSCSAADVPEEGLSKVASDLADMCFTLGRTLESGKLSETYQFGG
jgi:hypothetical protein